MTAQGNVRFVSNLHNCKRYLVFWQTFRIYYYALVWFAGMLYFRMFQDEAESQHAYLIREASSFCFEIAGRLPVFWSLSSFFLSGEITLANC